MISRPSTRPVNPKMNKRRSVPKRFWFGVSSAWKHSRRGADWAAKKAARPATKSTISTGGGK
jgi:hypothetical protein